jgi:hypothetical protein
MRGLPFYPAPVALSACVNCGAGPHEFCHDTCPETYRADLRDDGDTPCDY